MDLKKLHSKTGLKALAKVLGEDALARHSKGEVLSAYLESWSHPWLAAYAAQKGWKNCHAADLSLADMTGHFDHAPYALRSISGPAEALPFEAQDGPVYFVAWWPWVKAVNIVGQVENCFRGQFEAKHTWMPSWAGAALRHFETARHGFGCLLDLDSPTRQKAIQEATEALVCLQGDLGVTILAWDRWTALERELLTTQRARLNGLAGLLAPAVVVAA